MNEQNNLLKKNVDKTVGIAVLKRLSALSQAEILQERDNKQNSRRILFLFIAAALLFLTVAISDPDGLAAIFRTLTDVLR